MSGRGLSFLAPAKVNLFLHVCGKRENGYHELDSLVVFADVGDRIFAEAAGDLSLEITGPMAGALQAEPDNLVLKAARAVQEAYGIEAGAKLVLEKHLPVAAGIGGGSADAAAALRAVCALWGLAENAAPLPDIALSLGADVPVCLNAHPAFMRGIGERVNTVLGLPDCWMVLVNPLRAVSTPEIFKTREATFTPLGAFDESFQGFEGFIAALSACHNDLFDAALALEPSIGEVLTVLEVQEGCRLARMSGSGATCFGLFQTEKQAVKACETLQKQHPNWWLAQGRIFSEKF